MTTLRFCNRCIMNMEQQNQITGLGLDDTTWANGSIFCMKEGEKEPVFYFLHRNDPTDNHANEADPLTKDEVFICNSESVNIFVSGMRDRAQCAVIRNGKRSDMKTDHILIMYHAKTNTFSKVNSFLHIDTKQIKNKNNTTSSHSLLLVIGIVLFLFFMYMYDRKYRVEPNGVTV